MQIEYFNNDVLGSIGKNNVNLLIYEKDEYIFVCTCNPFKKLKLTETFQPRYSANKTDTRIVHLPNDEIILLPSF